MTRPNIKAWIFVIILSAAATVWGQDSETGTTLPETNSNAFQTANPALTEYFPDSLALQNWVAGLKNHRGPKDPPPPRLPRRFRWTGRYVVSDLVDPRTGKMGITVPFVWFGQDGNTQMIAGRPGDPIYFTNFIYNKWLYTYTYAWPNLQPQFRWPKAICEPLFKFTMEDLNAFFGTSRYVGKVILQDRDLRFVNHFRVTVVLPLAPGNPSGHYPRIAFAEADVFVEQSDSSKFRQVLHYGYQNLYDPELDEWILIDKFENGGGEMKFPPRTVFP